MKKVKKQDIAKTIEEALSENPALQKVIDKIFFKKSILYGFIMACLTAGLFSIVNALIMALELGWLGWLLFGSLLTTVGATYILKQWRG